VKRTPVASSVLRSIGYDADTAELEIEFTSGDVYRYYAVPARVHRDLVAAESPGAYFNTHVSDRYPTRQQY
jgi:lysyl-tRNA synthetase class 2